MVVKGLEFCSWSLGLGLFRLGFSVDVTGACGGGLSGFWGLGSLYKHRRINLGKKPLPCNGNYQ